MKDLIDIMGNYGLLIYNGFKMREEDEEVEVNDDKYRKGTVSQYTLRISDIGRRER